MQALEWIQMREDFIKTAREFYAERRWFPGENQLNELWKEFLDYQRHICEEHQALTVLRKQVGIS